MSKMEIRGFSANLRARWAGEPFGMDTMVRGGGMIDPAQFAGADSVMVDVGPAGAAQGATSVPVGAFSGPIANGTVLDFGSNKFARLASAAVTGDTSLAVAPLPTALVDADVATYRPPGKTKVVRAGTLVGRTFSEAAAGTAFGPASNSDDQVYVLAFDVPDADRNAEVELYRHGCLLKANFLPGWSSLGSALQARVRASYETIERSVA